MTIINDLDKPSIDDVLAHFGVKGQRWGVRKDGPEGVSSGTNREARKDAEEHTKAKLFYGEGAGTRRKLIKARVEAKSAKDPNYKKAFDFHVANTDLGKRAEQARGERHRKDAKKSTGKAVRGTYHVLNGNSQAASATVAITVGGALYAHKNGIDKVVFNAAKKAYRSIRPEDIIKGSSFLKNNGFI